MHILNVSFGKPFNQLKTMTMNSITWEDQVMSLVSHLHEVSYLVKPSSYDKLKPHIDTLNNSMEQSNVKTPTNVISKFLKIRVLITNLVDFSRKIKSLTRDLLDLRVTTHKTSSRSSSMSDQMLHDIVKIRNSSSFYEYMILQDNLNNLMIDLSYLEDVINENIGAKNVPDGLIRKILMYRDYYTKLSIIQSQIDSLVENICN